MTTYSARALDQAEVQANSIAAMVAALNVDYDRLEELRNLDKCVAGETDEEEYKEMQALEDAANGNDSEESAREAIEQDALEVQVREDWKNPGEESTPSEFYILLCTGGPAVRIMGELNEHQEPCRAWIEYQDWGTPWTQAFNVIEQDTLLTYCQQFYFGQ